MAEVGHSATRSYLQAVEDLLKMGRKLRKSKVVGF
jgi:hypothetical protein